MSSSCHQIPISPDLNSNCQDSVDGNPLFCTIQLHPTFSLSTDQRNSCIEFLKGDDLIAKFNLNLVKYSRICDEEPELFTRDVDIKYASSKRCKHAGSCQSGGCSSIDVSRPLNELRKFYEYPGKTTCEESCGGIGCSCLYPASGCLFTRTFAVPRSDEVYQLSRCKSWKDVADLDIKGGLENGKVEKHTVNLSPGKPQRLPTGTITMLMSSTPFYDFVHSRFLTNLSSLSTAAWTLKDKYPYLACYSVDGAVSMTNCTFTDPCKCKPAQDEAICDCPEMSLSKTFNHIAGYKFPIVNEKYHIMRNKDGLIMAELKQSVVVQFQMGFDLSAY
ncbi:hypothetical protein WR25_24894 [Diploscapter pachys]|uniref:Phlebovirus glycoprotein G2 fusion domain-containing protein n=1 Tax=Diploscapter pachys TaxID=2018661 RepID=A0A2A2LHN1_9BILA|nr:hypothetical protein WR25_24894 [Diploscapter pachys]